MLQKAIQPNSVNKKENVLTDTVLSPDSPSIIEYDHW